MPGKDRKLLVIVVVGHCLLNQLNNLHFIVIVIYGKKVILIV